MFFDLIRTPFTNDEVQNILHLSKQQYLDAVASGMLERSVFIENTSNQFRPMHGYFDILRFLANIQIDRWPKEIDSEIRDEILDEIAIDFQRDPEDFSNKSYSDFLEYISIEEKTSEACEFYCRIRQIEYLSIILLARLTLMLMNFEEAPRKRLSNDSISNITSATQSTLDQWLIGRKP